MNSPLRCLLEGQTLSESHYRTLFAALLDGEMNTAQIAATLVALKYRGEGEREILLLAQALLERAVNFPTGLDNCADCCGTGGDGAGLLNISTAVAFVGAAAGIPMVKHGNRAVSSQSGSADVLEVLGIGSGHNLPAQAPQYQLSENKLTFLFAPDYHPALKPIMPIRRALATRTIFNVLGPLVNPARPEYQLLGVYAPSLCEPMARTLRSLGRKRALVVHGNGLDELALHGRSVVTMVDGNDIKSFDLTPEEVGLRRVALEQLKGGTPEYNAGKLQALLQGSDDQSLAAYRDSVALNAAALLFCCEKVESLTAGVATALELLGSGQPAEVLQRQRAYFTAPAAEVL